MPAQNGSTVLPSPSTRDPRSALSTAAAVSCFGLVALCLTGAALVGRGALGPEQLLDRDPLYRHGPLPPEPTTDDASPVMLDYPRDLAFARGLHAGRAGNDPVNGGGDGLVRADTRLAADSRAFGWRITAGVRAARQ